MREGDNCGIRGERRGKFTHCGGNFFPCVETLVVVRDPSLQQGVPPRLLILPEIGDDVDANDGRPRVLRW